MDLPNQTPLFHAVNRDRYERQEFIRSIEGVTGRKLIVYVSNLSHPDNGITREDIAPFSELVSGLEPDCDVDLMIQSPGGDPNAAETLVYMLLSKAKHVRVIVPQAAKSAATLISLAADEIWMSDTSELGPVDPQVPILTSLGYQYRPAQAFLNGLKIILDEHSDGRPLNSGYLPFLQGVDAALIDTCEMAIRHTKDLAYKWLTRSMYAENSEKAMAIVEDLTNIDKYPSHGMVINYSEALKLGLNVLYQNSQDQVWQALWRLYVRYTVEMREKALVKAFESGKASVLL